MVYFDVEKLKNIKYFKGANRGKILPIIRVVIILALAGAVAAIVLLQRQGDKETRDTGQEARGRLTDEEKKKVLEGLSAPAGAPQYTDEEKGQILESLSAPSDRPILSDEEKEKILESLSAPQE